MKITLDNDVINAAVERSIASANPKNANAAAYAAALAASAKQIVELANVEISRLDDRCKNLASRIAKLEKELREVVKKVTKVGLDAGDLFRKLDQFQADIRDKVIISAVAAGAKVMYDEVRTRVPVKTGTLRDSIYRFYAKQHSGPWKATYIVGPNRKKAPHAMLVERGHWRMNAYANGKWLRSKSSRGRHDLKGALAVPQWVPARPYLRPAYDAAIGRSMEAIRRRFAERMHEELTKK